jgi:hypothetical protein
MTYLRMISANNFGLKLTYCPMIFLMSQGTWSLVSIAICSVIAFTCLIVAFRVLQRKRLIDDMPTSKTRGVFIGLVELKGTAESDAPLTSYLACISCVQYT